MALELHLQADLVDIPGTDQRGFLVSPGTYVTEEAFAAAVERWKSGTQRVVIPSAAPAAMEFSSLVKPPQA